MYHHCFAHLPLRETLSWTFCLNNQILQAGSIIFDSKSIQTSVAVLDGSHQSSIASTTQTSLASFTRFYRSFNFLNTGLHSLHCAGPTGSSAPIDVGHKGVVIRCLEAICDNGQLLVDIFVNYDCDLEGANLFERLVLAMVRIAQGNQDKEVQAAAGPEESGLRLTVSGASVQA